MDLVKEVREACWNATHDVTALKKAVDSAISKYKPQSKDLAQRLVVLGHGFAQSMEYAVSTMQDMHGLVLIHPGATESVKWYNPKTWVSYLMQARNFNRIVSSIPVETLEDASRFARSAMDGLEEGVRYFADMIASDRFDEARDELGKHKGGVIHGAADAEMAHRVIPRDPGVYQVLRAYWAAIMVQRAANPIYKDISKLRRARGD